MCVVPGWDEHATDEFRRQDLETGLSEEFIKP